MIYSCVGLLALMLNIILNHEHYKNAFIHFDRKDMEGQASRRYSYFLLAANSYFVVDLAWGILYANHDKPELFPFIYSDCVFYFLFMFLTMLTWMRYVLAYLNRKGFRSKLLLYAVWAMFTLGVIYLIVNRFYPFIFSFNSRHEYIPEHGRYIAFILQIALYVVTSSYMLYVARKQKRYDRNRYVAVGIICIVMEMFLLFQIFDPEFPFYAMGLMVGISLNHTFVEADEKREKRIYDQIATVLAEDYEAMYYIDIRTGEFREFSTSDEYASLNVPAEFKDFYAETQANIDRYVYPDDREFARSLYVKETMLKKLEGRKSYSYKYRIMVGGEPRYFRFTVMHANDDRHIILYEKDIDDEITAENIRLENQKKSITFSRIAESLASNYDVIYYVNIEDGEYVSFEFNNIYGKLEATRSGESFYAQSVEDVNTLVHKGDRDMVLEFMDKDHLITAMENKKQSSLDYRISVKGKTHYVRQSVRKTGDGTHFIIGLENIDQEVKKEKQQIKALNAEKELARRDELTGIKNKTAYVELESSVQSNIDNGMDYLPFALVVCDANNLKAVNDTHGHAAGDEYIKASAQLLCGIFAHSPVFRVGGDEFVVFLRGSDYTARNELMEKLRGCVLENMSAGSGPVLAAGMAEYEPDTDTLVSDIFDRADKKMYENKQSLKKV